MARKLHSSAHQNDTMHRIIFQLGAIQTWSAAVAISTFVSKSSNKRLLTFASSPIMTAFHYSANRSQRDGAHILSQIENDKQWKEEDGHTFWCNLPTPDSISTIIRSCCFIMACCLCTKPWSDTVRGFFVPSFIPGCESLREAATTKTTITITWSQLNSTWNCNWPFPICG